MKIGRMLRRRIQVVGQFDVFGLVTTGSNAQTDPLPRKGCDTGKDMDGQELSPILCQYFSLSVPQPVSAKFS